MLFEYNLKLNVSYLLEGRRVELHISLIRLSQKIVIRVELELKHNCHNSFYEKMSTLENSQC